MCCLLLCQEPGRNRHYSILHIFIYVTFHLKCIRLYGKTHVFAGCQQGGRGPLPAEAASREAGVRCCRQRCILLCREPAASKGSSSIRLGPEGRIKIQIVCFWDSLKDSIFSLLINKFIYLYLSSFI